MAMNKKREEEERETLLPKCRLLNLSSGFVNESIDFIMHINALGDSSGLCLQICLPIFYHSPVSLQPVQLRSESPSGIGYSFCFLVCCKQQQHLGAERQHNTGSK